MSDGRQIFFAMGGNFLVATPDTDVVFDGLKKCELTVAGASTKAQPHRSRNRRTVVDPAVSRPLRDDRARRSGEQFVSTESTMLERSDVEGNFQPASEHLRSEPWIVANLAKATLGRRTTVDWDKMAANYDNIRDSISRVVKGCENYNERVRETRRILSAKSAA